MDGQTMLTNVNKYRKIEKRREIDYPEPFLSLIVAADVLSITVILELTLDGVYWVVLPLVSPPPVVTPLPLYRCSPQING